MKTYPTHAQGYWRQLVAKEATAFMDRVDLSFQPLENALLEGKADVATEYYRARMLASESLRVMELCRRTGFKP